jgi:hypothetical protein
LHIAVKGQDELPSGTSLAEFLFLDIYASVWSVVFSLMVLACGLDIEEGNTLLTTLRVSIQTPFSLMTLFLICQIPRTHNAARTSRSA